MVKINSHAKGAKWERESGQLLSFWLTHGERSDIMSRNVLSGGSFTNAEKGGKVSSRMPGDIMAANPLAFRFLERFSIECKHLKDIGFLKYTLDPRQQNPLAIIIALARRQAKSINCEFMVIAKQNQYDPIVFVSGEVGERMLLCMIKHGSRTTLHPMYHFLHKGTIFALRFADMLRTVDPDLLLAERNNGTKTN